MPSPFPGMDPYLERPGLWPDVLHELIGGIRASLSPRLRPNYAARVELRVYISDDDDPGREVMVPDVAVDVVPRSQRRRSRKPVPAAIRTTEPLLISLVEEEVEEAYIAIREPRSDTVVTIIELLSPTNKVRGSAGRRAFMAKRRDVLASEVNWVEVDLLRAGTPSLRNPTLRSSDYRVIVSRAGRRTVAEFWGFGVRQPPPVIGIPLRGDDPDVPLDLGAVLTAAYDRAGYDVVIDYARPPVPPLRGDDARWANRLLREQRRR